MRRLSAKTVIFFLVFFASCITCAESYAAKSSDAGKKTYIVQLGAFSNYEIAIKRYYFLNRRLPPEKKTDLRIEKTPKYYTVRVGKSLGYAEALKIYQEVRPIIKDVFLLRETAGLAGTVMMPDSNSTQPVTESHAPQAGDQTGAADQHEANTQKESSTVPGDARAIPESAPTLTEAPAADTAVEPTVVPSSVDRGTTSAKSAGELNHQEVDSKMASFLEQKKYRKAVNYIKKAIARSPQDPALHSWYGSALIASNRPYQALAHFRKAAELAPGKPEYQNGIGYSYVYINIDSARQSIDAFTRVLKLDPNNIDALEGLGAIYINVGEKQQAYRVYRQLVEKDQNAAKRLHTLMSYGLRSGKND